MAGLPFEEPFVLDTTPIPGRREGSIDVYLPEHRAGRSPAVLFVHGGPIPAGEEQTPRDWPVFVGYGRLAAGHGLVGVTVDHRLYDPASYPLAQDDVAAALDQLRALPEVDPDRIALWFFSGGGPLCAGWIARPPNWLRCLALTYPLLATPQAWALGPQLRPIEALRESPGLPILLTRVGRERFEIAATVAAFLDAAADNRIAVDVIDVPDGQHSFDVLDHTEQSRDAVTKAISWVADTIAR
jgi:acetyl esterase/lipase